MVEIVGRQSELGCAETWPRGKVKRGSLTGFKLRCVGKWSHTTILKQVLMTNRHRLWLIINFYKKRATRFELATCSLGSYHSTTELHPQEVAKLTRRLVLSSSDHRVDPKCRIPSLL